MSLAHLTIPRPRARSSRWHQTLKNRVLLGNYYLPGDLEAQLGAFVEHYNHRRYHESLNKLTPADVYFGRGQAILLERERIKRKTIEHRACNIATPLPEIINLASQSLRYPGPHPVSNHLTADMGRVGRRGEAISPRDG